MTYSKHYIGVPVSRETHERLTRLKGEDTYDNVVKNLLELEEKYDMPEEIMEYEYMLSNDKSKLFKVTFGDTTSIEYYNRKTHNYEKDIRAWFAGNRISDQKLNEFVRFIVKDANLMLLYDMEKELIQNNIWIKRV